MNNRILWQGMTEGGLYQVADTLYDGRPARVLFSGKREAAQSGIASDDEPELLFDYNQRLLEFAEVIRPTSVLIVGGGAGTLATALLKVFSDIYIDMVEPDKGLTDIAYKYFGLPVDERLQIHHTDGLGYLRQSSATYDFVVLDAFTHSKIPTELRTIDAFGQYKRSLSKGGVFAANIISGYYGPSSSTLKQMCTSAKIFTSSQIFIATRGYSLWLPQNFILLCGESLAADIGTNTQAIRKDLLV